MVLGLARMIKEEQWLNDMSNKGYHLVKPEFFGRYEFYTGSAQELRLPVRLHDRQERPKGDISAILFGCRVGISWRIWELASIFRIFGRKVIPNRRYTRMQPVRLRNISGLVVFLVVLLLIYLVVLSVNNLADSDPAWLIVCIFLSYGCRLFPFFVFSIVKLFLRIQELKKTIKQ